MQGSDQGSQDPELSGSHAAALIEAERICMYQLIPTFSHCLKELIYSVSDLEARLKEIEVCGSCLCSCSRTWVSRLSVLDGRQYPYASQERPEEQEGRA